MANYQIVAGTTASLDFQLLEAGTPMDITGFTLDLLLSDRFGVTISSPGTLSVLDSTAGKVRLDPANTSVFDATKSPYTARWKLTSALSKVSYVPTGHRDIWEIIGA